jgi:hypothetical protein
MEDNRIKISIKDNIWTDSRVCSAGSRILYNFIPGTSSTVHSRLKKCDGVRITQSVELEEFASGSWGYNTLTPLPNPNTGMYGGGSSIGSAISVLNDDADVSVGTDTGGSCRVPALLCGLVGFKPSFGVISRHGVIDLCNEYDTVGLISKDVTKLKTVFELLCGYDVMDHTCLPLELPRNTEGPFDVISCDFKHTNNNKVTSFTWAINCISEQYQRTSNRYFYSNLLRLDGRRFNETIEGYKTTEEAKTGFNSSVLGATSERFLAGFEGIRSSIGESEEYMQLRRSMEALSRSYLVFKPTAVLKQYGKPIDKKTTRGMEYCFALANLFGRPSVISSTGFLVIGPVYSDYIILDYLSEIIELAR